MEMANITYQDDERAIKVKIDYTKCIACGRCVSACKHKSRHYEDDTERFFSDLKSGTPVSVIAAPSIRSNIPDYKRLFTYLRRLGVNKIYDVSLGADICTWAHIRYIESIEKTDVPHVITQPCPSIVLYCEGYRHDLVKKLSPVQSPMACASIYMRRYEGIQDSVAALSPCIAKAVEFEGTGLARYNVTFSEMRQYLDKNNIELPEEETGFDHYDSGIGSLYPMPGGLKENIEFYMGKKFRISRSEGSKVYKDLDDYINTPEGLMPEIFDVLNCSGGCNMGTACIHDKSLFEIDDAMNNARLAATENRGRDYFEEIYKKYDGMFDITDFMREYHPVFTESPQITEEDIEKAFILLDKDTYEKQNIDCGACGSGTCRNMARKIALGVNIPTNCMVKNMDDAREEHAENVIANERLAMMEKMHEADEHFRVLLDSSPLGVMLWDRDLKVITCNNEAIRLFGFPDKQEYIDRFFELSPEYQPDGALSGREAKALIRKAFEEGLQIFEWVHMKADGGLIPTEITLVRVDFKGEVHVASYIKDLTEQKKIMREIERNDKLLDTVNRTATILLAPENDNGGVELSIRKSMELIGRAMDVDHVQIWKNTEKDGDRWFMLAYEWLSEIGEQKLRMEVWKPYPYSAVPELEKLLLNGEDINSPLWELPENQRKFLGKYEMKSIIIIPMFLKDEFWGFFSMDDCVRERSISKEEMSILRSGGLLITNALLRSEMTKNLAVALEDAKEASIAKSNFLANMSHEIRTPMNAITGMTQIGMSADDIERKNYSFDKIKDASKHLLGVINDILDVSKIESGKFELSPVEFNFNEMMQRVENVNKFRIDEKNQDFEVHIDNSIPEILFGDEQRLAQVITNLLSNAVKFTPEKGSIKIYTKFLGEEDGICRIQISIVDSGIGISKEQQAKLFQSFQQAESQTSRKFGGTGLGLAISKSIVEMMGGDIRIESELGKGATFIFTVKAKRVEKSEESEEKKKTPADREREGQPVHERFKGKTILLAEDVEINREIVLSLLEPTRISIDCAEDGAKAVSLFSRNPGKYDAIFMDVQMPEMDGYEATRAIRALSVPNAATIPIIAMTANVFREDVEKCLAVGMNDHVGKPLSFDEVLAKLRAYLD